MEPELQKSNPTYPKEVYGREVIAIESTIGQMDGRDNACYVGIPD
jgi:hypothetical protein